MSEELIDIGLSHRIRFAEYKGDPKVGLEDHHKRSDNGADCQGWVTFEGSAWARVFPTSTWKVLCWDPLTLEPSLLCRSCGDHGFIRNGRWVKA